MAVTEKDSRTDAGAPRKARPPKDAPKRALLWSLLASLPINLALWGLAGTLFSRPRPLPPPAASRPILVQLIRLASPPRPMRKPLRPNQVRQTPRPKPRTPKPIPPKPRRVLTPRPVPRMAAPPKPAPPRSAARSRPTAHPTPLTTEGQTPTANSAPPGGNATPGPATPPAPDNTTPKSPAPGASAPPADPTPPADPPADPAPKTTPSPPASAGPTRSAQPPPSPAQPEIPEELRDQDYQASVHVTVQISAEGRVTDVTLHGSTGSRELDRRVVDALKRWRWQPALRDGNPVPDTHSFLYKFTVS